MSFVDGAMKSEEEKKVHLKAGCQVQNINHSYEINVPATTLTAIIDKYGVENIDLFYATCGGMGLTGVIFSATIQLIPISSSLINKKIIKAYRNL